MPVQVFPASHGANAVQKSYVESPVEVLQAAWPSSRFHELLQSSFTQEDFPSQMASSSNGFVSSIVDAYCMHHHLQIRPDDVWFAVLTQLSIYINKHAEELRGKFVAHEGQKELVLVYGGQNRYTMDFGVFAQEMTKLLEANVVDPELREWMMPEFTTTTRQDKIVASILMMGSLQKYFSYTCMLLCGIPSVTLLGEKEDYAKIMTKLDKLSSFGKEPDHFQRLLKPVVSGILRSFDDPKSPDVLSFWQRAMSRHAGGSGPTYYSGWVTAFCFWNEDGNCLYRRHDDPLVLDGIDYHWIQSDDVPPGWGKVPVKVNDNGEEIETEMVAGSVGINCFSSRPAPEPGVDPTVDTMQPQTGWWIYSKTKGEHPTLTDLRQRAAARGLKEELIERFVEQSLSSGSVTEDHVLDFYAKHYAQGPSTL